jgi:hypothetical protein
MFFYNKHRKCFSRVNQPIPKVSKVRLGPMNHSLELLMVATLRTYCDCGIFSLWLA